MSAFSGSSSGSGSGGATGGQGFIGPVRAARGAACGAVIDMRAAVAPVAPRAADPPLPANLAITEESMRLLRRGIVGNAFSGAVNIASGEITIYPLADEAYPGGDRTFDPNGDGYSTSRFPGALPYQTSPDGDPIGYPQAEDSAARPLGGGLRARRMSNPGPGPGLHVTPIRHMDPNWQDEVSHEQIARRVGGIPAGELTGGPRTPYNFVGFTLWLEYPALRLVCTSRALNQSRFNAGGRMSTTWANTIRAAFVTAALPKPSSGDDLGIL